MVARKAPGTAIHLIVQLTVQMDKNMFDDDERGAAWVMRPLNLGKRRK